MKGGIDKVGAAVVKYLLGIVRVWLRRAYNYSSRPRTKQILLQSLPLPHVVAALMSQVEGKSGQN